jgi:hypothetical protein
MKTPCLRLFCFILLTLVVSGVFAVSPAFAGDWQAVEKQMCTAWTAAVGVGYGDGYVGRPYGTNLNPIIQRLPWPEAKSLISKVYEDNYVLGKKRFFKPGTPEHTMFMWNAITPECRKYH